MVIKHHVDGYEEFCEFFENVDSKGKHVHVYFSGSKSAEGKTWCDDCQLASPLVEKELEKADPESHFVHVDVGDRETWKDPSNPFRKDPRTMLLVIPTLLRWDCAQRLEGEKLNNPELIAMLLTYEDDD